MERLISRETPSRLSAFLVGYERFHGIDVLACNTTRAISAASLLLWRAVTLDDLGLTDIGHTSTGVVRRVIQRATGQ